MIKYNDMVIDITTRLDITTWLITQHDYIYNDLINYKDTAYRYNDMIKYNTMVKYG